MYSEIQRVVNTSSEEMMAKYQVSQVLSHLRGLTVCRERKLVVSGSYSILNEKFHVFFIKGKDNVRICCDTCLIIIQYTRSR